MDRSSQVDRWNHTAQILCKLHNVNATEKKYLREPWQFHPFGSEVRPKPRRMPISALKGFVINRLAYVKKKR